MNVMYSSFDTGKPANRVEVILRNGTTIVMQSATEVKFGDGAYMVAYNSSNQNIVASYPMDNVANIYVII